MPLSSIARACYVSGPRTSRSPHRSDAFCRGVTPQGFTMRYPMVPMVLGDQADIMSWHRPKKQLLFVSKVNVRSLRKSLQLKKRSKFYPNWVYILGRAGKFDQWLFQVTFGSREFGISGNYFVWWGIVIYHFILPVFAVTLGCSWGG